MTVTEMRLRELVEQATYSLTDKNYIERKAIRFGVDLHRKNCSDCYRDACIEMICKIAHKEQLKDTTRKNVLRAGVDVIWKGVRINAQTSDEDLAKYIAGGFPKTFLARYADNE